MALINCPECSKQISDSAPNCPNCGFPLRKQTVVNNPIPQNNNNNPSYTNHKLPPVTPKPFGCLKIGLIVAASVIGISIVIGIIANIVDPIESTTKNDFKTESTTSIKDTISVETAIKNDLERELKDIDNLDFSEFRGSITQLQLEIVLFNSWRVIIENGENSSIENKALAKKLKDKVTKIQTREFPILRREYAKEANKIMWEYDIEVTSTSNNTILNFTGGIFAANKNKKEHQQTINQAVTDFRFKQVRYRWYKGADEYTYYDVYNGKDSDLVYIN